MNEKIADEAYSCKRCCQAKHYTSIATKCFS